MNITKLVNNVVVSTDLIEDAQASIGATGYAHMCREAMKLEIDKLEDDKAMVSIGSGMFKQLLAQEAEDNLVKEKNRKYMSRFFSSPKIINMDCPSCVRAMPIVAFSANVDDDLVGLEGGVCKTTFMCKSCQLVTILLQQANLKAPIHG